MRGTGADRPVVARKALLMGLEPRGRVDQGHAEANPQGEEPRGRPKPNCRAGLREPYDERLSRTVLREREGEVPSRYSPGCLMLRCSLSSSVRGLKLTGCGLDATR